MAVDREALSGARVKELKMRRVESDAGDQPLGGFLGAVLSVADDRVADGRKLRPDLVLQSRHQRNPDERGAGKKPFDGVSKLGASGFGIFRGAQPLKHSVAPKIVNESPFAGLETPAKHGEILPHGSMGAKLPDEHLPIGLGFRKEQNAGRETIDAMNDKGPLSLRFQPLGEQR